MNTKAGGGMDYRDATIFPIPLLYKGGHYWFPLRKGDISSSSSPCLALSRHKQVIIMHATFHCPPCHSTKHKLHKE